MKARGTDGDEPRYASGRSNPAVGISLPPPPPAALPALDNPGPAVGLRRTSSEPRQQNAPKPAISRGKMVPNLRQEQHLPEQQQRQQPLAAGGSQTPGQSSCNFEGVLYKRRDFLKKRWRPRYFILNTQSGVLTYYLLTNETDGTAANAPGDSPSRGPFSSPLRGGSANGQSVGAVNDEADDQAGRHDSVGSPSPIGASRFPSAASLPTVGASNLAAPATEQASKQPQYDVVPRGTIYLPGCAVRSNGSVGSLHALKITPSSKDGGGSVHLAATSSHDRDLWVARLGDACHIGTSLAPPSSPNAVPHSTPEVGEPIRTPPAHAAGGADETSSISTTDSMAAEVAEAETAVAAASIPSPSRPSDEPPQLQPQSPTPADSRKPAATSVDQLDSSRCTSPSQSILRPYRPPSALDEEDSDDDDDDDEDEEGDDETGEDVGAESVLRGVPPRMVTKINSLLDTYLPMCDYDEESHSDPLCPWKLQWQKRGVKAYQYKPTAASAGHDARYPMLKSVAVLDFPAHVVVDLLWDINQREAIEQLLSKATRLRNFNNHSAIDYFAYKPFWPSSGRDFFVANHWRELPRGDPPRRLSSQQRPGSLSTKTYALLSFSIIDDSVCPPKSDHVRANLLVSLYVLSAMPGQDHRCRLVRIVSADLGGSIPSAVVGAIQQQAAFVPAVISDILRNKGSPPRARMASIDVSDLSSSDQARQNPRRWSEGAALEQTPARPSTLSENTVTDYNAEEAQSFDAPGDAAPSVESSGTAPPSLPPKPSESEVPSVVMSAFVLALPLVARKFSRLFFLGKEVAFVAAAVACIRFLAIQRLGNARSVPTLEPQHGQVSCRFNVDLKGVLRFLGLRKEEREEKQAQRRQSTPQSQSTLADSEISVTHIVVKAVARALSEFAVLNCRRVKAPIIALDGYYGFESVDVTVASGAGASENPSAVTLRDADRCSVQAIANLLMEERSAAMRRNRQGEPSIIQRVKRFVSAELPAWFGLEPAGDEGLRRFGSCVVFTSPDSEHSEVDIDVSPVPVPLLGWKVGGGSPVVTVVVGGVRVMRDARTSAASPVLSMSITIDCPVCDISTCRKFAERVQRYLQFPEVCDGAT